MFVYRYILLLILIPLIVFGQWSGEEWLPWNKWVGMGDTTVVLSPPDYSPPDSLDTAPVLAFTAPYSFDVSWLPSEIDSPDVKWLRLTLFDDCNFGIYGDDGSLETRTQKTLNIPWATASVDSDTAFFKPVFYNYTTVNGIITSYWGTADTTATTYLILSLIDSSGNLIAMDTVSVGDTINAEITINTQVDTSRYTTSEKKLYWHDDTTGWGGIRNAWYFTHLDSSDLYIWHEPGGSRNN